MNPLPRLGLLLAAALPAQSPLVTTFASNAAGLPNGAVYFDLDVTAHAITVTRLDLNLFGTGIVEVYTCNGSRVGKVTNPAAWTLRGVSVVNGAIAGNPTTIQVPAFALLQGTHGVAIRGLGVGQAYTIGTGTNQTYWTGDVTLHAGEATHLAFSPPVIAPRVVNAAIHYLPGALVGIPGHQANANGFSRGFGFTAATDFNIRQLALPPNAFQAGDTASYVVLVNGVLAYRSIGNAGAVSPDVHVATGNVVDVIACWTPAVAGQASAHVSGGGAGAYASSIEGVVHSLQPVGWSWDIGDPSWVPTGGSTGTYLSMQSTFGRVLMTTEPGTVQATNTVLGSGCTLLVGSCYELATGTTFDLDHSAVTFTPQPGGGYAVTRQGALLPVGATSIAAVLPLLDDGEIIVPLTVGTFPGWQSLTIAANGIVSKNPGNPTGKGVGVLAMLDALEDAFWHWHDFDPSIAGGGRVKLEQSASRTVITWDGVWDYAAVWAQEATTLQFQLHADGRVTIAWGAVSNAPMFAHLVGYSPGGDSPDPGATDFSALGTGTVLLSPFEATPLALGDVTAPVVGSRWELITTSVPPTAVLGVDVLGLGDPGIDDLAALGMPGCGLRASLDLLTPWVPSGPFQPRSALVPNAVSLRGTNVYATSVVFTVPTLNTFGAITSNGIRGRIGDL